MPRTMAKTPKSEAGEPRKKRRWKRRMLIVSGILVVVGAVGPSRCGGSTPKVTQGVLLCLPMDGAETGTG